MASDWEVPEGYELTRVDGHFINDKGFVVPGNAKPLDAMIDGTIEVPHFVENEPFVFEKNDGRGVQASDEAKQAALAGEHWEGWSPNAILLPIKDGWVPPQFVLIAHNDATPVVEPHESSLA